MSKILIEYKQGKKAVKLVDQGYGLELYSMRNGYQWVGCEVDDELIEMMQEVLNKYLKSKEDNPHNEH